MNNTESQATPQKQQHQQQQQPTTTTATATTTTSQKPSRGFISFLPLGMSCRGRAEAFARRLQIRLRSLNSQDQNTPPSEPDTDAESVDDVATDRNGVTIPLKQADSDAVATQQSPTNGLHEHETPVSGSEAFYDVDLNGGSGLAFHHSCPHPIPPPRHQHQQHYVTVATNTTTNNTHTTNNSNNTFFDTSVDSSLSSSEGTFFDLDGVTDAGIVSGDDSAVEPLSSSLSIDYYDCDETNEASIFNSTLYSTESDTSPSLHTNDKQPYGAGIDVGVVGGVRDSDSSDSGSESLPVSQSTSLSSSATVTGNDDDDDTVSSNAHPLDECVQKQTILELCLLSERAESRNVPTEPHIDDRLTAQQQLTSNNSDEDTTLSISPTTDTDELLAADPLLDSALEHRDDEEACDATDAAEMVVNDDSGHASISSVHEDGDLRPQRLRRCSSLKSGKTPPGTPGRKKFVRFADVFGLDLADVKTFMDEIPTVPRSAYDYLTLSRDDDSVTTADYSNGWAGVSPGYAMDKVLTPMFQQPGGMVNFLERVREQNVCLENALVTDPVCLTISGTVRVRNLDFHKSVHLRYTLDEWTSFADFQATYVEQSCDGFSDKFAFTIFGNSLRVGQRLQMAVRFSCKGEQFWDSNYGVNYCFHCVPAGPPAAAVAATPLRSTTATSVSVSTVAPAPTSTEDTDMLFY